MSAYVVGDETINKIVDFLRERMISSQGFYGVRHVIDRHQYRVGNLEDHGACEILGHDMREMNVRAVRACYEDRHPDMYPDEPYQYEAYAVPMPGPVAVYKGLRCFLYQCSEGDVPDEVLYQFLDQVSDALAHDIVGNLPEYEMAEWD